MRVQAVLLLNVSQMKDLGFLQMLAISKGQTRSEKIQRDFQSCNVAARLLVGNLTKFWETVGRAANCSAEITFVTSGGLEVSKTHSQVNIDARSASKEASTYSGELLPRIILHWPKSHKGLSILKSFYDLLTYFGFIVMFPQFHHWMQINPAS